MRNTLFLLAVALLCAQPSVAQTQTGREKAGLFGPAHIVRSETVSLSNVNGRLLEGRRTMFETMTFDEQGRLTEDIARNLWPPFKYGARWAYTYDALGRVTEEEAYDADGAFYGKIVTTYDEKTGKGARTYQNRDGSISETVELTFDAKGRIVREMNYNAKGASRGSTTRIYDDKGWLLVRSDNAVDGEVSIKRVFTHDGQGRVTGWTCYNRAGAATTRFTFVFDEKGNFTETRSYDQDILMNVSVYTYTFDPQGNWIKRVGETVSYTNGQPQTPRQSAQLRTITYY